MITPADQERAPPSETTEQRGPESDGTIGGGPNRHRLALLTWVVVYPVLTVLLYASEPVVRPLPLPLRTFVLSGVLVPFLVYIGMPVATRRFDAWLHPTSNT